MGGSPQTHLHGGPHSTQNKEHNSSLAQGAIQLQRSQWRARKMTWRRQYSWQFRALGIWRLWENTSYKNVRVGSSLLISKEGYCEVKVFDKELRDKREKPAHLWNR